MVEVECSCFEYLFQFVCLFPLADDDDDDEDANFFALVRFPVGVTNTAVAATAVVVDDDDDDEQPT